MIIHTGVYIFLFDPPPPYVGGKKLLKGMKKRGKMHIFSPIGKKYSYFFPNSLKNLQNYKKGLKFFAFGTHHLIIIYFLWAENINQQGWGGQKYEFQI